MSPQCAQIPIRVPAPKSKLQAVELANLYRPRSAEADALIRSFSRHSMARATQSAISTPSCPRSTSFTRKGCSRSSEYVARRVGSFIKLEDILREAYVVEITRKNSPLTHEIRGVIRKSVGEGRWIPLNDGGKLGKDVCICLGWVRVSAHGHFDDG